MTCDAAAACCGRRPSNQHPAAAAAAPAPAGIIYSSQVSDLGDLLTDDEAAEREAAAQGGVPGYCGDRYFKAFAGGERVCDKLLEKGRR